MMTRYRVKMRVYDTIEVEIDAPDGCMEQEVIERARVEASVISRARQWQVDEERTKVVRTT